MKKSNIEIIEFLSGARRDFKIQFYCDLSWYLTVDLRATYGKDTPQKLFENFNEYQHRILGRLRSILSDEEEGTDQELISGLLKNAEAVNLLPTFQRALDYCGERLRNKK